MSKAQRTDPLPSWRGGTHSNAKENIIDFVEAVSMQGHPGYVEPEDRIAVFDNDGTLWSERPAYVQADFVDYRQNSGPSPKVNESLEEYADVTLEWLRVAKNRDNTEMRHIDLIYQPMLELLDYLRANGFKTYIISGGGIEFVRPWGQEAYGIPPEQVCGSSGMTAYLDNPPRVVRLPNERHSDEHPRAYKETFFMDDKEGKVVGINTHIGRRPIAAFGNSDGDFEMLEWCTYGHSESDRRFGLIVNHTDGEREWNYAKEDEDFDWNSGGKPPGYLSKDTLNAAHSQNWTVVDMASDWKHVSPPYETIEI